MIINKGDFISKLSEEEFNKGCIKFNIPDEDNINSLNGEGVWGYVSLEDREKYDNGTYAGTITAILVNQPIEYFGRLNWGDEVILKCHGDNRPTLDPEWVKKNLKGEEK